MQVLSVPESHHLYVRRLTQGLRSLGVDVREAPFPYLRWPRNSYRFVREVLRGPDVWQLHWNVFDSLRVAKLFLRLGPPKAWTVHNLVPHQPQFRDDFAMTALYLDRVEVAVWHSQRSCDAAREAFRRRGLPSKWSARDVFIPHISFNGAFPDDVTANQARRSLGIPEGAFVVGHYAPTHPYKGTEDFLVAAANTPQAGLVFCVFGECLDPGLRRKIESAALSNPRLRLYLDRLADDRLQYWFKACDLVVQPYREVTTSGSIHFAIAFRRPVVATPLGNIPDVIRPGVTGWLADGPADIVERILEARSDPARAEEMGQRAYDLVNKTANPDLVCRLYLEAYERIAI